MRDSTAKDRPFETEDCTYFKVEENPTKCYNTSNERGGKNNMSIVGILKCADGKVIAFGDSKSSICQSEEKGRITQKVFKFEDFIIVTYGNNRIDGDKLEDIINEYPKNFKNFTNLFERLSTRHNLFDKCYNFLVYSNDSIYIKHVTISQNKINIEYTDSSMCCGGDEKYRRYIQENFKQYFKTVEEAKEYFQIELEKLIRHFDNTLPYNPCGLPIKIEIF